MTYSYVDPLKHREILRARERAKGARTPEEIKAEALTQAEALAERLFGDFDEHAVRVELTESLALQRVWGKQGRNALKQFLGRKARAQAKAADEGKIILENGRAWTEEIVPGFLVATDLIVLQDRRAIDVKPIPVTETSFVLGGLRIVAQRGCLVTDGTPVPFADYKNPVSLVDKMQHHIWEIEELLAQGKPVDIFGGYPQVDL